MVLITLLASNVYAEKIPDKPFKVCGEKPVYPCIAMGPTVSVVHRTEIPKPDKEDREQIKMVIQVLRDLANALEKDLDKPTR
jgi:hypothetical protein